MTEHITDEQLTELEEARKKADKGVWVPLVMDHHTDDSRMGATRLSIDNHIIPVNIENHNYLRLLLVHAPALIAEVRRLREENKRLDDRLMAWELRHTEERERLTPEKIDKLAEIIRKG